MSSVPIIDLKGITFAYPGMPPVLKDLSFTLNNGDRIGLVAPNGSGKTTLFHIIMGLLRPLSGKIEIFGQPRETEKDFEIVRQRVGLLFQDADDQLFSPTVLEDVAFGPLNLGQTREEAIAISRKTLDFLGLSDFEDRITFKLSGGEKRLVSLATVLAMRPEVLLLDEPTTGLDQDVIQTLAEILSNLEISFILITHNLDFLKKVANTAFTLRHGKILTDKKVHIHEHVHAHPHGTYPHEHD